MNAATNNKQNGDNDIMAKTTTTVTTEQQPVASPLSFDFNDFDVTDDNDREKTEYPRATWFNESKPRHGLFIEDKELLMSGWQGKEPDCVHTFRSGKEVKGILLQSPRLLIVRVSLPIVQATDANKEIKQIENPLIPGMFFPNGALICPYMDENGFVIKPAAELYAALKLNKQGAVRTGYLAYVVSDDNILLHRTPFVFSVHGSAAIALKDSYNQFKAELYAAYAQVTGKPYKTQNQRFCSLAVYHPTFTSEMKGDKQKSPCCVPQDFVHPDGSSPEALAKTYLGQYKDEIHAVYDTSKDFMMSLAERDKEFMPALPGAFEVPQLPQSQSSQETGEEAITVPATAVKDFDW